MSSAYRQVTTALTPARRMKPGFFVVTAVLVALVPLSGAVGSAFGSITIAVISLYPFKLVVPLLGGVLARGLARRAARDLALKALFLLGIWALASLAWAPNFGDGLREASIFLFAGIAAAGLCVAVTEPRLVRALFSGWMLAVAVTAVVAAVELASGQHLDTDFVRDRGGQSAGTILATFGNPNNFGAFLALAMPIVALPALGLGRRWYLGRRSAWAGRAAVATAMVLLVATASRFAMVAAIVAVTLYLALNCRWRSSILLAATIVVASSSLVAWAVATDQTLVTKFGSTLAGGRLDGSSSIRLALIMNGVAFATENGGLGLGAAGYEQAMLNGDAVIPVRSDVINAHNFWIEILSQYGIVGFALLLVMLGVPIRRLIRAYRFSPDRDVRQSASVFLAAIAGYFFAAMSPSSYVNEPLHWAFVATILSISTLFILEDDCTAAWSAPPQLRSMTQTGWRAEPVTP